MEDQKVDELLNLAMEATEEEREKSIDLETGYDARDKTWELIVRYTGSLDEVYAMNDIPIYSEVCPTFITIISFAFLPLPVTTFVFQQ